MAKKTILVTGGAGYIGSHVVRQLTEKQENVIVLDDLSTGFADAVLGAELIRGDSSDMSLVNNIITTHNIDTVMHFAAKTIVPESVENPLKYYLDNTCKTRNLLACCQQTGIRHFVFSSTSQVYGIPSSGMISEDSPTQPINPYGTSKLMSEHMLRDLAGATDLKYVALRYFNVAGADPKQRIGQSTEKATLLIKVACEAAVGKRPGISIFGTNYDTPDGTGVRDYIHVEDLADAHLQALNYLRDGGQSDAFNCGYGHGFSVKEVLNAVERIHGQALQVTIGPRRPGDPAQLIAKVDKIKSIIGWQPQYDDLDVIVETALKWEKKLVEQKMCAISSRP